MTLVGVFQDPRAGEAALGAVRDVAATCRARISRLNTEDGIAGEAPGQSFENQPGQAAGEGDEARRAEALRSAACAVSVSCEAPQAEPIRRVLKAAGATEVWVTQ